MTSDSTPAFEIEKEALKTEIETGIQAGVDHLEAKTAKRKDADKYHNTRHLLKQYRKVAYAIQISEADMNVRMEMEVISQILCKHRFRCKTEQNIFKAGAAQAAAALSTK